MDELVDMPPEYLRKGNYQLVSECSSIVGSIVESDENYNYIELRFVGYQTQNEEPIIEIFC